MHSYPIVEISPFDFYFITDNGLDYFCLFRDVTSLTPILGVYDIHVFEFQFFQSPSNKFIEGKRYAHDGRIAITIASILQSFFEVKERIVLYLCDSSDGKQRARQRLFEFWHRSISNNIISIPIFLSETIESYDYETCGNVMYTKNFEQQKLIQDYLIDKAIDILTEKYGL